MASKRERQIAELLERLRGYSLREAGDLVGVSHDTIGRIRAGEWENLRPATWRTIDDFLNRPDEPEQPALDLFGEDFDAIVKYLHGMPADDPEEARLRKLDALEGLRRFFSAVGPVPSEWYRLKKAVEQGDI